MSDLNDLIERLEKATGPDRELDGLIFQSAGGDDWERAILRVSEPCGYPRHLAEKEAKERLAPHYTASLDAALTLVSEGWEWSIGCGNPGYEDPPYCNVWPRQQPFPAELDIMCEGATPALALCIAALRARASSPSSERRAG